MLQGAFWREYFCDRLAQRWRIEGSGCASVRKLCPCLPRKCICNVPPSRLSARAMPAYACSIVLAIWPRNRFSSIELHGLSVSCIARRAMESAALDCALVNARAELARLAIEDLHSHRELKEDY